MIDDLKKYAIQSSIINFLFSRTRLFGLAQNRG
jgi:hypothetical protein